MSDSSDPPIQSHEYPELLDIQPSSFRVELVLNTDIFLDLHLTNLTSQLVTFKVKTTARDRYQLKPTQGYIPPHTTKQCKIVLSALSAYPDASNSKNVRDKFLVQSVTIGSEVDDLGRFWKERETRHAVKDGRYAYAEQIVKCKLNVPSAAGGGGNDSPSRVDRDDREREREERREEAAAASAGGGGGVIIVDEVKEQLPSIQKQQSAAAATSNSTATFTPQQRLSYPPAISITSTPTQPSPHPINAGAAHHSTASLSSSFSSTPHPPHNQHDNTATHPNISTASSNNNNNNNNSSNNSSSNNSSTNTNTTGVGGGGVSGNRSKEYNDLMEFTVRLTAQMEREKADAAIIADKYNKALAHIALLQKRLAVLTAQQQRDRNLAAIGEAGERGEEEKGKSAPAAGVGGEGKEEKKVHVLDKASSGNHGGASGSGSSSAVGMRERLMSGDGVRNNSGGLSWQIYQVILVAIIAFVLGRLLSK